MSVMTVTRARETTTSFPAASCPLHTAATAATAALPPPPACKRPATRPAATGATCADRFAGLVYDYASVLEGHGVASPTVLCHQDATTVRTVELISSQPGSNLLSGEAASAPARHAGAERRHLPVLGPPPAAAASVPANPCAGADRLLTCCCRALPLPQTTRATCRRAWRSCVSCRAPR